MAVFCKRFRWRLLSPTMVFLSAAFVFAEDADRPVSKVHGKVVSATLYRESALVTREVTFEPDGDQIVVEGLPQSLRTASVVAEAGGGVSVRGVRVSPMPGSTAGGEAMEELETRIEDLKRQSAEAAKRIEIARRQLAAVERMLRFGQDAGDRDLRRGVLDAGTLIELVDARPGNAAAIWRCRCWS